MVPIPTRCQEENGSVAASSEPLEHRTTAEAVASRLRRDIQIGDLAPGTRLRQSDIAARFGVSTTPVREAFTLLQAEGLVRLDPHRGAVVFRPTLEEMQESYEIREALERLAIAKAVPNLTPDDIERLGALIDEMRGEPDDQRWMEMNNDFHMTLYRASGMTQLCSLIESIRAASSVYIHMFLAHLPAMHTDDEHAAILEACKSGDVQQAQQALTAHLRHAVIEDKRLLQHD